MIEIGVGLPLRGYVCRATVAYHGRPALVTVLAREGVLNVAQSRFGSEIRIRAGEARAGVGIVLPERFQPALRGLPQIVEGAHETFLPFGAWRPLRSGRKKVRGCKANRIGWEWLPCRGREAPQRALTRSVEEQA